MSQNGEFGWTCKSKLVVYFKILAYYAPGRIWKSVDNTRYETVSYIQAIGQSTEFNFLSESV